MRNPVGVTLRRRLPIVGAAAALAAGALGTVASTPAAAAPKPGSSCGQRHDALPKGAKRGSVPLVVGDSVLYDAVAPIKRAGIESSAMICRRMDQGLTILRSRKKAGTLPSLVILELGANWVVTTAQIKEALSILGTSRQLVMLTPTDDDPPKGVDAKRIKAAAKRWPDRMRALDWAAAAKRHPSWMAGDGVHLGSAAGIAAFADMVASAVPDETAAPAPDVGGSGSEGSGGAIPGR